MSRRTRILIALVGLLLLVISAAALSYAYAPVSRLSDQTPVIPTLLTVVPGGGS